MEQLLNEIRINYIDAAINKVLSSINKDDKNAPYIMHFSQAEEYFIEFDKAIFVPKLPIHHNVFCQKPEANYISSLLGIVKQLTSLFPECFFGMTYFFDPAEILKPCFFKLFKAENDLYLYLLRIDLLPKPFLTTILESGTNDETAAYSTTKLFIESEIIPLESIVWDAGKVQTFKIKQLISQTWIGESGKGYLVHGVWMDTDLSKFFTRLFLTPGKKIYPFFPLFCKYKTICANVPILSTDGRRKTIPILHRAIKFISPEIEVIQNTLKTQTFSDKLPEFINLKKLIPEQWLSIFSSYHTEPYLNDREQKEYILNHDDISNN